MVFAAVGFGLGPAVGFSRVSEEALSFVLFSFGADLAGSAGAITVSKNVEGRCMLDGQF